MPKIHDFEAFKKAGEMLDKANVPRGQRSAWMNYYTFMALGGTQEVWDQMEGDEDMKLIHD